jgi:hypothetical protein
LDEFSGVGVLSIGIDLVGQTMGSDAVERVGRGDQGA